VTDLSRTPRLLTWLLRVLPRAFRDEYADDMAENFAEHLDRSRQSGRRAVAALWLRTVVDVMAAGVAERWRSSLTFHPPGPRPRRGAVMAGWIQDFRFAVRRLRREPIYALFVVLTLALGIGANVAVFSVVNGVLIRALPYPDSDRLVAIWGRFLPESGFDFPQFSLSIPELVDYQRENRTMASVGGWLDDTVTIGGVGEEPERVSSAAVTPSLFDVLRVPPALGRVFGDSDRQTGPEPVVILSYPFWQRRFAGRRDIVGQSVVLNGTSRTIVGVMPRRFEFPAGAVLWTPLVIDPANPGNRQAHSFSAIGRLADTVAFETARQEMDVLMRGWRQRFPVIHTGHYLYLTPLLEDTVGGVKSVLLVVLAATAFLLLIVCANIASLVLARAEGRAREAAIRIALGSGRWRLARLSLAESALLAMTGGLAGALLAAAAVSWLQRAEGVALPRLSEVVIDARVWIFTVAVSAVAACLLGVLPALRMGATRMSSALREDTRTSSGGGRGLVRRSLVVIEVALAVVLVVGAALMLQSFQRLISVDAGFRTDRLLLANVSLPSPAYADDGRANAFFDSAIDRLSALPGVSRATLSTNIPLLNSIGVWDFLIEGREKPGPGQPAWNAAPAFVRDGFLEILGIRLVRGRFFTREDREGRENVAVVTEAFARKFFANQEVLDRRIRVSGNDKLAWARVVGIAGDIRDQDLDREPRPMYFLAHAQAPATAGGAMQQASFVLRTAGEPTAVAGAARAAIRELDPSLPLYAIRTYDAAIASAVAQPRFVTLLLSALAAFGLALGVVGVYGVLAFTVAERTHEIGIRRALGAPTNDLVRLMLVQGLAPVLVGVAAGCFAALSLSGTIRAQLFGVSPTDPATYAAVVIGVMLAAAVACLAPTYRALRVSLLTALRDT
jgi:putative ABC transport system permease protein